MALMQYNVTFSRKNRRRELFYLNYLTRNSGYVGEVRTSFVNEAAPRDIALYEDYGTHISYAITPERGQTYRLEFAVLKGFDEGQRDLHFHLSSQPVFYRLFRATLDLTGYLKQGYTPQACPCLYHYETDQRHSDLIQPSALHTEVANLSSSPGVYAWELRNVAKGVVDIRWDVSPPPT